MQKKMYFRRLIASVSYILQSPIIQTIIMITKETIDEIMLAAKIEEVVNDFVPLKKRGQNYVGLCPFHQDKTPSMSVSPRLGIYNCFVCDNKGGPIQFIMNHEQATYPEALRYLAAKYGIAIKEEREKTVEEKAALSLQDSLFIVNQFAEQYFHEQLLNSPEGQNIGLAYFEERGIPQNIIEKFKLGYCPEGWTKFTETAKMKGHAEEFLLKLGLSKKSEAGKVFDFFHGRVIFPIHNTIGKCVGFGGRTLKSDKKIAKYFNSPESEIYHKSNILYGFHLAKKAIRAANNVYLVEGYTDVISLHIAGVENVVASSGTALTQGQIKLVASQTQNITVLYDGDTAGIKASLRGIELLIEQGLNVYVVPLPEGEDPDSFARKSNDNTFQQYLKDEAVHFIYYKAKIGMIEAGNDPLKKAQVIHDIVKNIAFIRDNITRAFYIKECANIFQIPEEDLNIELRKAVVSHYKATPQATTETAPIPEFPPEPSSTENATAQAVIPEIAPVRNSLFLIEEKLIHLLLKYGMYEITVVTNNDTKAPVLGMLRIDQYIFNELYKEEISIANPVLQQLFLAYEEAAPNCTNQEEIKRYFTTHPNNEIASVAIRLLMENESEISPNWKNRFDVATNSSNNNVFKLNKEVESTLTLFKLQIIEKYIALMQEELQEDYPDETIDIIMRKYSLLLKKREQLSRITNTIIIK